MKIKVLGTGCRKCRALEKVARAAVAELGIEAEFELVKDIKDIMAYDVFLTPGLVVEEKLVLSGRVPSLNEMKKLLAV
ncbi:MAG TPA: thioredoxin family protein [bacterium]|jgi:small redox-active disulfide protein 2|nr:thioredoxin family protein [bacterium]